MTIHTDIQTSNKEDITDVKGVKTYLELCFGDKCKYNETEKTVYLYDNEVLTDPLFIAFLGRYKIFIQPMMF